MPTTYKTPGVYIVEKNAFPGSAVAVETAVPVFIGYTEKATRKGETLIGQAIRVTSFAEYVEMFGYGFNHKFKIVLPDFVKLKAAIDEKATAAKAVEGVTEEQKAKIDIEAEAEKAKYRTLAELSAAIDKKATAAKGVQGATGEQKTKIEADAAAEKKKLAENFNVIKTFKPEDIADPSQKFYFYNSIRLFYQNGGSNCYILSIGTYGEGKNKKVKVDRDDFPDSVFETLKKTFEPTLVVIPDFVTDRDTCYDLYVKVLRHCRDTQSRFGIFDVIAAPTDADDRATILYFRSKIGSEALNYGAAYYPWLNTSIVSDSEVNFDNLDIERDTLLPLLLSATDTAKMKEELAKDDIKLADERDASKKKEIKESSDKQLHQALLASSTVYKQIIAEIKTRLNLLPPSSAMVGVYSLVDSTSGVWKSPANISLSMVNSPAVNISHEEQQNMNVDAVTGISVNAIRPFPGLGSLVWGASTLDGNSQDWQYINLRRTMIMIEQSLKLACRTYVFEPNDSGTWVTMKSMINNFLNNLWKQGALAGAVPEQAFEVQIGLGATMTPNDILEGLLLVTVKLALVRPAEFIVLTFMQQQQQS
jgi:phage tail sheath protein FI